MPTLINLNRAYQLNSNMRLMNLETDIKEYHAGAGSETMFDFSKGDPLAGTHIDDMHKTAGANIDFTGATGQQELGVVDQFQKGSQKRLDAAASTDQSTDAGRAAND